MGQSNDVIRCPVARAGSKQRALQGAPQSLVSV